MLSQISTRLPFWISSVVLGVVLLAALPYGSNAPLSWTVLSIFIFVLCVAFAISGLFQPVPFAVRRGMGVGCLILLAIGWGWLQTIPGLFPTLAHPFWQAVPEAAGSVSADPGQGRPAVMRLLCYCSIFFVTLWGCTSSRVAMLTLYGIAVFSTLLAAFGIFSFATGENAILGEAAVRGTVQSSFVNRNNYATYAVFGALANLAAFLSFMEERDINLRARLEGFFKGAWIFLFGFILCVGAVSLTQSRAGGMAGLIGVFVFVLAWRRKGRSWDPIMLGGVCVFLLFIAVTSATGLVERLFSTDDSYGRFLVFPAVVTGILDRPLSGHGLGAFYDAFRAYLPLEAAGGEWFRAHNTYLEMIFALGIPAAVLFFGGVALIVWQIRQGSLHRRRNRAYPCFALSCFAAAGFHAFFDFSLQIPAVAALFAVIAGLGFAQSFSSKLTAPTEKGEMR